jgi:hypothetical protein
MHCFDVRDDPLNLAASGLSSPAVGVRLGGDEQQRRFCGHPCDLLDSRKLLWLAVAAKPDGEQVESHVIHSIPLQCGNWDPGKTCTALEEQFVREADLRGQECHGPLSSDEGDEGTLSEDGRPDDDGVEGLPEMFDFWPVWRKLAWIYDQMASNANPG